MPTATTSRLLACLLLALGLTACADGGSGRDRPGATADVGVGPIEVEPAALRLVFDAPFEQVACNGRLLACAPTEGGCAVHLHAAEQGWPSAVVLCQAVQPDDVFAPVVPLVFKDGLPIWTPNLDAAGQVRATPQAMAIAVAFLSPYLTATYPETARALLAQAAQSPYLDALTQAIYDRDEAAIESALRPVVVDVLAQGTVQQPLTSASVGLGMDHVEVMQTSDYLSLDSRLGTSINHVCVVYALDECVPDSEVALAAVTRADVFPKRELGQIYVPSKSYFEVKNLARAALVALFGDRIPAVELETIRLEPGRVHDIQCFSGALGLADEAEARADGILISEEPRGRYYVGFARVANLVSLAIDTLKLFVDFKSFGDQNDIAKAVSVCAAQALGPSLELADGTSREEWFSLLKTIQGCAIRQLGILLAKRGVYALAALVFDFAEGGGSGIVGRVTRAGMLLDRVVGMLIQSPVQRTLLANEVDFVACAPCEDACPAEGARRCTDPGGVERCVLGEPSRPGAEACLGWAPAAACAADARCAGDGDCVPCGGLGEPCCARSACEPGNGCVDDQCVSGCRDTCPAVGVTECADRASQVVCGEHDGDPCLEWGPAEGCAAGEICEVDACGPPSCEDACDPGDRRCTDDGAGVETCGQCDDDGCREWCAPLACEAHFTCDDAACVCEGLADDLPDSAPGVALEALDDSGVSAVYEASLWPEGDMDVVHAYIDDTAGNSLLPRVDVLGVEAGLTYDVCLAYACDPEENSGEIHRMDCGEGVRTTRDGLPTCCLLGQQGPSSLVVEVSCSFGGLSDDSGTATVYVESMRGAQCWPPARVTLTGGED